MKINAALCHVRGARFQWESVDLEEPKDTEVLVRIKAAGICHTDEAGRQGVMPLPFPAVFGHEGAGIVEKVGIGVTNLKVGDHVALTFGSCGRCRPCLRGDLYACEEMVSVNFKGLRKDGSFRIFQNGMPVSSFFSQSSFADYAVVDQSSAVKIADDVDFAVAAPVGCGIQTGAGIVLNQFKATSDDAVAVFGCGTVGMSALMGAKLCNCRTIIAVGGNEKSLALAKELGATHTVNRRESADIPAAIRAIVPEGVNYAVDTSGNETLIKAALGSLNYLGTLAMAGAAEFMFSSGRDLGAKTIVGVTEGHSVPNVFIPRLIEEYRAGRFPIDRLIKRYPAARINEAFEDSNRGAAIKAVLEF